MTIFEKLKDIIGHGWEITFSCFAFQFNIKVQKELSDGSRIYRESSLPLEDHFYEEKIVDCIKWSVSEIQFEINKINSNV